MRTGGPDFRAQPHRLYEKGADLLEMPRHVFVRRTRPQW